VGEHHIEQTFAVRVEATRRPTTTQEWRARRSRVREAQDKLLRAYQTQDVFVPEGGSSTVSGTTPLNDDYVAAQTAHNIERRSSSSRDAAVREDRTRFPGGGDAVAGPNAQIAALTVDLTLGSTREVRR
jgi:hypothetical protein